MSTAIKNILSIDDDEMVHDLLRARLEEVDGYRLSACLTGQAARKILRKKRPDLILLDWNLPDEPGLRLLRWIKGDSKRVWTPVFMLTMRTSMEDVETTLESGATGYFTKPINLNLVSRRLRSYFDDHIAA